MLRASALFTRRASTGRRAVVLHALLSVARWQHGWLNRMRTCALARSGARLGVCQMGMQQGAARRVARVRF